MQSLAMASNGLTSMNQASSGGSPGILDEAARLYGQGGQQYYPGATVAGLNPYQTGGIDSSIAAGNQMAGYIPGMMAGAQGGMDTINSFAQGGGAQLGSQYTNMMGAGDFNNIQGNFEVNPFINDQVDAFGQAAERTLNQNILPSTTSNALGAGQMGSSRHGIAQGLATANLGQTLQEQLANLHGSAWQNAAQNQLTSRGQTLNALGQERDRGTTAAIANANNKTNAMALIPGAMNAFNNTATTASNIGQIPGAAMMAGGSLYQQTAQDQINAERERWNHDQNQPWQNLQNYAGIVQGVNYNQAQQADYTNPWASGMLGAQAGLNTINGMGLGSSGTPT